MVLLSDCSELAFRLLLLSLQTALVLSRDREFYARGINGGLYSILCGVRMPILFWESFMFSSLVTLQSLSNDGLRLPQRKSLGNIWGRQEAAVSISRSALITALEQKQMQAWLQPKVCLHTQRLVAVEVLARWCHPTWGVVTPTVFLTGFKAYGLDEALLLYMLQEALVFQAHWRSQGMVLPVAVNLPTYLLDDPCLAEKLLQVVQSHHGETAEITFELLETSDTATPHALYAGASQLVSSGFGLALDDFGVNYSSIQRLMSVPFSELKLDRSLVQGVSTEPRQAEQVRATIDACKQRDLIVTAEGVECLADLAFLRQAGCDYAQGYLWAKPLPATELAPWMRGQRPDSRWV